MANDVSLPLSESHADDLAGRIAAALNPLGGQCAVAARRLGGARRSAPEPTRGESTSAKPSDAPQQRRVTAPGGVDAIELRAEQPLPAGALAHLAVVVELSRRVDLGQFALTEGIGAARGETAIDGDNAQGGEPTLGNLCARALVDGDAGAADMLLDLVGIGEVNETLSRLNLKWTHLVRGFVDAGDEPAWRANRTSARDMLALLGLTRGAALPGAAWLRARLAEQRRFPDLAAALPKGAELAHLPALDAEVTHDAGMLGGPGGACAYCVLVAGASEIGAGRAAVIAVVRLLWEAWCAG